MRKNFEFSYLFLFQIFLFLASVVVGFLAINALISFSKYNLYNEKKWESSKTKLEKALWGSWAMMLTNTALKGGCINMNAWHGFQELSLKNKLEAKEIKFSVSPGYVPFSFIINNTDTISPALYFNFKKYPSISFYLKNKEGKFLSIKSVACPQLLSKKILVHLVFEQDSVKVFTNKRLITSFFYLLPSLKKIGFKGSEDYNPLLIDDIVVLNTKGETIFFEKVDFPFSIHFAAFIYLFIVGCLGIYGFKNEGIGIVAYISWMFSIFIIAIFVYYYYSASGNYNYTSGDIDWHGIKSKIEQQKDVENRIKSQYKLDEMKSRKIVLFIGSSQTWGAGASTSNKTFTSLIEEKLKGSLNDTNIVVMNCGVSGTCSSEMYQSYISNWIKYNPILVVINNSFNDSDSVKFRAYLEYFASYNKKQNIKTIFMEEPSNNGLEATKNHLIMRDVATKNNFLSIDLQSYIESYKDSGFIWWDAVHLTDYGQELFANRVFPIIKKELINDSFNTSSSINSCEK